MPTPLKLKRILSAPDAAEGKSRRAKRNRCRIFATMTYVVDKTPVKIVDISTTGMAVDLAGLFRGIRGSKVRIECPELGVLEGTVRWLRDGRMGLEFDPSSNAAAQVTAYFRFFHKEATPVLRR